jgi:hypothetical protein
MKRLEREQHHTWNAAPGYPEARTQTSKGGAAILRTELN